MVNIQALSENHPLSTVNYSHAETPSSTYRTPIPSILPRWSTYNLTMHPALSTNYVVPGLLLNPVLLLWSINTILSRCLPPLLVDAATHSPPYYTFGPSAEHPHINVHASESLCWSYTAFIVCANLAAFGRVSGRREESKERARLKKEQARKMKPEARLANGNGNHVVDFAVHTNGGVSHANGSSKRSRPEHVQELPEESDVDRSSPEWTDLFSDSSETIL